MSLGRFDARKILPANQFRLVIIFDLLALSCLKNLPNFVLKFLPKLSVLGFEL